jgi:mannosyl-3-phosphoglycerate phosphatase family protein
MGNWILFTDVDGTLLDSVTYELSEGRAAVRALIQRGIHIVLCSSKTRLELERLRSRLGLNDPFVVENGSAIVVPKGTCELSEKGHNHRGIVVQRESDDTLVAELGIPAHDVRDRLDAIRRQRGLAFKTLDELSAKEVVRITGLSDEDARAARLREYSATLAGEFTTPQYEELQRACHEHHLNCMRGTRFVSVTGDQADKGRAVRILRAAFRAKYGTIRTFGVGDSWNDVPMLRAVDVAFQVQSPDGGWRDFTLESLVRIAGVGPAGFRLVAERICQTS